MEHILPNHILKALVPETFVKESLASGHRLDGRSGDVSRKPQIATVGMNGTAVMVGIKHIVVEAPTTKLTVKVARSLFADSSENQQDISATALSVEKIINSVIDFEQLKIAAYDQKFWNLEVDLFVLESNGSLLTCSTLAVVAALLSIKLPTELTFTKNAVQIPAKAKTSFAPVIALPVVVDFVRGQDGAWVVDPTEEEKSAAGSFVSLLAQSPLKADTGFNRTWSVNSITNNAPLLLRNGKSFMSVEEVTTLAESGGALWLLAENAAEGQAALLRKSSKKFFKQFE